MCGAFLCYITPLISSYSIKGSKTQGYLTIWCEAHTCSFVYPALQKFVLAFGKCYVLAPCGLTIGCANNVLAPCGPTIGCKQLASDEKSKCMCYLNTYIVQIHALETSYLTKTCVMGKSNSFTFGITHCSQEHLVKS